MRMILACDSSFDGGQVRGSLLAVRRGLMTVVSCTSISPWLAISVSLGSTSSTRSATLDELDLDRHLVGQIDQSAGVQFVIGAEAGNAAGHRRVRDPAEEQVVENRRVTCRSVILLALDYVDGHLLCWSGGQHRCPPASRALLNVCVFIPHPPNLPPATQR